MSIATAKKLLEAPSNSLEELLDCLILLSKDCGYLEATEKIGWRDSVSVAGNLSELHSYIEKIKNQIRNYAQASL